MMSSGLAVEGGLYGGGQLQEFLRPLPPAHRYRPIHKEDYPRPQLFQPQLLPFSAPYLYQHQYLYPPVHQFKPPQAPPPPPKEEPRVLKHRVLRKRTRAAVSLPSFTKGSLIQLASGELKRVEELTTQDFVSSAEASPALRLDPSTVVRIDRPPDSPSAVLTLMYGPNKAQVEYESNVEQPFFVVGETWASCCPERTLEKYGLKCAQLQVGDVCVSLSPRQAHKSRPPDVPPSDRKRRWSAPDELPEPPPAHLRLPHKD